MGDKSGTTYRRPSVSIGMGLDGTDYSYLTKKNNDNTGFFITFNVPFKRQDIFTELLNDNGQLGSDGPDAGVKYRVLKPGREEGKPVRVAPPTHRSHVSFTLRRALRAPSPRADGRAPVRQSAWPARSLCQVSSGCVREAIYSTPVWGRTITELREIKAPAYIRWSTLMQQGTFFQFIPKPDDNPKIQSKQPPRAAPSAYRLPLPPPPSVLPRPHSPCRYRVACPRAPESAA